MRISTTLGFAIILVLTGTTVAGDKAGVFMPDTIGVAGKSLQLNGMGLREATVFKVDVYVAGLYLERVSSNGPAIASSRQVKRLVLRFVRDVSRKDILKAWHEGFRDNATVKLPAIQGSMDRLDGWMGGFSKGDTLTFTYVPVEGVRVEINNVQKGILSGDDFAASLFSIWLGPKPPTGALKRGLLGNHGASS